MSTHCNIGIRQPDGTVLGCYVHYDGYPDNMVPSIMQYVSERTMTGLHLSILSAAEKGGFHGFIWQGEKRDITLRDDDDPELLDKEEILDYSGPVPYVYIACHSGKLECYEKDHSIQQFMLTNTEVLDIG